MPLLDDAARQAFISTHPAWRLDAETITRTFTFDDFVGSLGFVTKVALLAERAFHHPDIDIRWNTVKLTLSTHSAGGLTDKDTDLAAAIDGL